MNFDDDDVTVPEPTVVVRGTSPNHRDDDLADDLTGPDPGGDEVDVDGLVALAALDALDERDRDQFELLLVRRSELVRELEVLRFAAAEIVGDEVSARPSPQLRAGVLAAVAAIAPDDAGGTELAAPGPDGAVPGAWTPGPDVRLRDAPARGPDVPWLGDPAAHHRVPWPPPVPLLPGPSAARPPSAPVGPRTGDEVSVRRRRPRPGRWLAAAAVLTAVAAAGVVGVRMGLDRGRVEMTSAAGETMAMEGSLGNLTVTHRMGNTVEVSGTAVPMPPTGMVYELWATNPGDVPHPMGTFVPEPDGTVAMTIDDFDPTGMMLTVTTEPGAMDAPSGEVVAQVQA